MLKCFANISNQRFFAKYLFWGAFQLWAVTVTCSRCPHPTTQLLPYDWVTSTHQMNPSLTYIAGSHPRACESSHSLKFPKNKEFVQKFVIKVNKRDLGWMTQKDIPEKKTPQSLQHNTNALHFWPDLVVTDWCMMQQPSYSSRKGKPIASQSWIRRGNS